MERQITRAVVSRALALLCAWGRYGSIGLLHLSVYPWYEELRLLEEYVLRAQAEVVLPDGVITAVRADLLSLCRSIASVHPTLWHQHLLTEPPASRNRQAYAKRLFPRLHQQVVAAIAQERGCTEAEAGALLTLFVQHGLAGLIDRHLASATGTSHESVALARAVAAARRLAVGLDPTPQAEIEHSVPLLFRSIETARIPLSLEPLLTKRPSTYRRIRWGRMLRFGVPSIAKSRSKRQAGWWSKPAAPKRTASEEADNSAEKRLIAEFARLSGLTPKEAKDRLRNVLTYGVLGLLPKGTWYSLFDARLMSWLRLMRFGHVEGALLWSDIYRAAERYSAELGITPPASQLLRGVYTSIQKPRFWHGGKGIAVINVHARLPQVVTDRPRLHAAWIVVRIKLDLAVTDVGPAADHSYLLLVVDAETELPVGAWLSAQSPRSREVGLALYQAIWHPGKLDWPIRGIPRLIRMPKALVIDGQHDLERAAALLLTTLDVTDASLLRGKKRILRLLDDIKAQFPDQARRVAGQQPVMVSQALRALLDWLQPRCFPAHRSPKVRKSIRELLVGMPGHDTPAAGWLLPVLGTVEVHEDYVLRDRHGRRFTSQHVTAEPGTLLSYRTFPYFLPVGDTVPAPGGIFIEMNGEGRQNLHYAKEGRG